MTLSQKGLAAGVWLTCTGLWVVCVGLWLACLTFSAAETDGPVSQASLSAASR